MAIEAISGFFQPTLVRGDDLTQPGKQDVAQVMKVHAAPPELPTQAVKSVTSSEKDEQLKKATDKTNEYVKGLNRQLRFSVGNDNGSAVAKVTDRQSGEVIRQIPAEEMVSIANHLDSPQGVIIREKV